MSLVLTLRRFSLCCLLSLAALPLHAGTPELDPLAGRIAALSAGPRQGSALLELARELRRGDKIAQFERDPALRRELEDRLAELRRQLLAAAAPAPGASALFADGLVEGRVTDDGEPLVAAQITIFDLAGQYLFLTQTGADGRYSQSLPPGSYVLYFEPPFLAQLSPQLYAGIDCVLNVSCQPADATPLVVVSGGHLVADAQLKDYGHIAGQVRHRETREPIDTFVTLFRADGSFVDEEPSPGGSYVFAGLPPGDYLLAASGWGDAAGMIHRDLPCNQPRFANTLSCPSTQATRVRVDLEQQVEGIDFDLFRGARLEGRVVDALTGMVVPTAHIDLIYSNFEPVVPRTGPEEDGFYRFQGVAPGRFYLKASAPGYTTQIYESSNCAFDTACLFRSRPLDLELGVTYRGLDFRLQPSGKISGRVMDEAGQPLLGASVELATKEAPNAKLHTSTDGSGRYSFEDVPATFQWTVHASHFLHVPEYFDDVDARRGIAAAKSIPVGPAAEVTGIDFRLAFLGGIEGKTLRAEDGTPIEARYALIPADDPGAAPSFALSAQFTGNWSQDNLLPGRYYLVTSAWLSRAPYLYGQGSCNPHFGELTCPLAAGTPIEVRSGEITVVPPLRLERGATLGAKVTLTGAPALASLVTLRVFADDGAEVRRFLVNQQVAEHDFANLAPGTYYLTAEGGARWQSVAAPDQPCSRWYCDPQSGAPTTLAAGGRFDWSLTLAPLAAYGGCVPSDQALCLNHGRFRVSATWRDFLGATGSGVARELTADTGYFYFFSPGNLEVMVKALNACDPRLGHHFWVFAAGLTNVGVTLRVEDTLTGAVQDYTSGLGEIYQPLLDLDAFATCDAVEPPAVAAVPVLAAEPHPAAPSAAEPKLPLVAEGGAGYCQQTSVFSLCLGGRFQVDTLFDAPGSPEHIAFSRPITADTGAFHFFSPANLEMVVKVLDACDSQLPGHWVFASGLTDLPVRFSVTDLANGRSQAYRSGPGPFAPILDLGSFPCD